METQTRWYQCAKNNEYVLVKKLKRDLKREQFVIYFRYEDIKQAKSDEKENKNGSYVPIIGLTILDKNNQLKAIPYHKIKAFNEERPLLLILGRKIEI